MVRNSLISSVALGGPARPELDENDGRSFFSSPMRGSAETTSAWGTGALDAGPSGLVTVSSDSELATHLRHVQTGARVQEVLSLESSKVKSGSGNVENLLKSP